MKGKKPKPVILRDLLTEYLRIDARVGRCYKKLDSLFPKIMMHMAPGEVVELEDGRRIQLVDVFEQSSLVYRTKRFSRYELKEL